MKKLLFFNDWHNGDIHMSREYVKDLVSIFKPEETYYYHINNPTILKDLERIKHTNIKNIQPNLVINTWIGQFWHINNNFNGCNFLSYYNVMKELYSKLGILTSLKEIENYIPSIDYTKFNIQSFKSDKLKNKKNILFCNNLVNSKQSQNFDFSDIINNLSKSYKNINFIITNHNPKVILSDNVFYTTDVITGFEKFDLNEISYLSTKCDAIIGRSSGPYSFSVVKENILQNRKKFVCFSNTKNDAWFLNDLVDLTWSNDYSPASVTNKIIEVLEKI